ncbi:plastocyanin/azurin family copper-binding protein [Halobaculum marinum]|uniref:Plastocyanin/azurin family copper-binding protein n=1 Tax=Halobaculum marinum TaxID=3031996 RepID=A0ABD5X546_9EURY|nr:plastocyanin/azurin family copper-binding protein [Halobaculum sp. DT55]
MGHSQHPQTGESRIGQSRRDVLKALGVGTGLAAVGGTAAARPPDRNVAAQQEGDEDGEGEGTGVVHDVLTRIVGPPTAPGRPADFFYEPTGLHVEPGDVLRYVFTTPDHNVVAMHPAYGMQRRVPIGVAAFSSPLLGWRPDSIPGDMVDPPVEGEESDADSEEGEGPVPDEWTVTLDTPGVYDLVCSPHEGFGMAMRVVVGDVTETAFETTDPDALPEPRAGPVGLARVTLTDPALQPEAIVEAGRVEWSDLAAVQSSGGDGGESENGEDGGNGGESGDEDGGGDTGDDGAAGDDEEN